MWPSQRLTSIGLEFSAAESSGSVQGPTGNQTHRHATRREDTSLHGASDGYQSSQFWTLALYGPQSFIADANTANQYAITFAVTGTIDLTQCSAGPSEQHRHPMGRAQRA